jgi:parvulin-like peptidyl-prolyl isomerase
VLPVTGRHAGRAHAPRSWARPLFLLAIVMVAVACGGSTRPSVTPETEPTFDPAVTAPAFASSSLPVDGPPVATVDGAPITRQEWADRVNLIRFRYGRELADLKARVASGEVTQQAASDRLTGLASDAAEAESIAVDDLIDLALQRRLAGEQRLTVTTAEVDAAEAAEAGGDAAFESELAKVLSETAYRRNLEAEVLAGKLREEIIRQATSQSGQQVKLSEIVLRAPLDPDIADTGAVRASHIVYSPNDDWVNAPGIPMEDPAWAAAQDAADATIAVLGAITDPAARTQRFAELARSESDEPQTAAEGGDMGWVTADELVPATAEALLSTPHEPGDVIGPVQTEWGIEVLLYVDRRPPLEERVSDIRQRLAEPDADFAAIAREESDGETAADGGVRDWMAPFEADPAIAGQLAAATPGQIIGPVTQDVGVVFYRVDARETRTLSPEQLESLGESAFEAWYGPRLDAAIDSGLVVRAEEAP